MYVVICILHSEIVKCENIHLLESRTCKLIVEIEENLEKQSQYPE